jgi:hypothetical protein
LRRLGRRNRGAIGSGCCRPAATPTTTTTAATTGSGVHRLRDTEYRLLLNEQIDHRIHVLTLLHRLGDDDTGEQGRADRREHEP